MACASLLTELVQGRTIDKARQFRREELVTALGGLPSASIHASHLAIDALGALIQQLGTQQLGTGNYKLETGSGK